MKKTLVILVVILGLLMSACAPAATPAAVPTPQTVIQTVEVVKTVIVAGTPQTVVETVVVTPPPEEAKTLSVFGAYATAIEEPWDGVIHSALQKAQADGRIAYEFTDDIGYAGDMERVLREVSEQQKPDIIFGDAFGNEEAVRRVAKDYPEIAFVFGSGGGPAEPNFSVFDNWIHEPAYLSGMLAGGLNGRLQCRDVSPPVEAHHLAGVVWMRRLPIGHDLLERVQAGILERFPHQMCRSRSLQRLTLPPAGGLTA